MAKKHGHYCKVCGEYKSNESFSGKGHAAHICKKCAALPAAQRSEDMTLTKLWNLPWQLSQQQRDWLKGLQNDSRPEVASTAKEIYADRFPRAARNERNKQLHISHMEFIIHGEVFDEHGDSRFRELHFTIGRKEHTVQLRDEEKTLQTILTDKEMRKLLNVIVNNYDVVFWDEDYGSSDNGYETDAFGDEEEKTETEVSEPETFNAPDDIDNPSWAVSVSFLNGESQEMRGYGELPLRINELVLELLALFEEEADTDDFEDNDEFDIDDR